MQIDIQEHDNYDRNISGNKDYFIKEEFDYITERECYLIRTEPK